jgi:adenosylhomocysteinase
VAAALAQEGVHVFAWRGMDGEGYYRSVANVIRHRPQITLDDGADVVSTLHKLKRGDSGSEMETVRNILGDTKDWIDGVWAGAEETTTGVIRLRAMASDGALLYPIAATNDTPTKWEFDNLWGTGQSTIDGILRATADLIAGKVVVVAGYGHCGRGVALRAKGLGARRVIISEVSPHRALTAAMEGCEVMTMREAAPLGDIFVTATGCKHVIRIEHIELMKDGAVLCNTGHFDIEIDIRGLSKIAVEHKSLRPHVERFALPNGRHINLLAEGRLVNLVAAEGHPSEVMDMSFANQALTAEYLTKNHASIASSGKMVIDIPSEIDTIVARLKCQALDLHLDKLTPEQDKYLTGWQEGTT